MLKISKEDLATIERQLYNKARDIDVAIYNAMMDPTAKDFVVDSLMLYLTKDGGIGNGLDIDNYNPNASVYQIYEALRILAELDFTKEETSELYIQLLNKLENYLFNRSSIVDGLWNPLVKSNDDYAHSEEYNYMENPFSTWGVHPTAAILGYVLLLTKESKAYYKKAMKQIQYIFSYFEDDASWNSYSFISYNALVGALKKTGLFVEEVKKIEARIKEETLKHLDDETFNFPLYLSHISVDGILEEKINEALDELISSRAVHGLWDHKKGWGSNRYPEADSASLKWIGAETVWNLHLLKKYGRLEE
ncbi:MAG: hypothetical protein K2N64_05270 [Anaeroplasmataceae bacterium]|nr:hypothetical protein [Anaeroplasmataceae bacterium]